MSLEIEIERKYLIRMPDEAQLATLPGCEIWEIDQTYLTDGGDGSTRRVRRVCCRGDERFFRTWKWHINEMSNREEEEQISRERYVALLREADTNLKTIHKRRYRIPYAGQMLEVDIYAFWQDRATLEVELSDEKQTVCFPEYLQLVRELTGERAYKNRYLAERVPMEVLD